MAVRPRPPRPAGADLRPIGENRALTQLFGFVQFELPGTLSLAAGRYLVRDGEAEDAQSVLVLETLGAPPPSSRRRRRRAREASTQAEPSPLPLARATVVRASTPFEAAEEATRWLRDALEQDSSVDSLLHEGLSILNRALYAQAATTADPSARQLRAEDAVTIRIGYGSGEEVAAGRFAVAHDIDVQAGESRRRQREAELQPQERVAGVLRGRETLDACEMLLLRARADLDGGHFREAALQLRVGLEALLVELSRALTDPGHEEDLAQIEARRGEVGDAANMALHGPLDAERERNVRELLEICERVLRRRRILRG